MITHDDIARALGLSKSTVSYALNRHPKIPEDTRRRVHEKAEELGYRRNPLVDAHMEYVRGAKPRKDRPVIALVHNWAEVAKMPALAEFIEGARRHAEAVGFGLEVLSFDSNRVSVERLNQILESRGTTGVIVAPLRKRHELALDWSRLSAVAIGYSLREPQLHRVFFDPIEGTRETLRQLAALGYARPGLALRAENDAWANHLYSAAFAQAQLGMAEKARVPILWLPDDAVTVQGEVRTWLRRHRPDVVITHGGSGPGSLATVLPKLGVRVPEDIGLCVTVIDPNQPQVAGLSGERGLVAAACVDLVTAQMRHNETGVPEMPKQVLIRGRFVHGPTLRAASAAVAAKAKSGM